MASFIRNIRTRNYQNLVIFFKLQSKMSGMLFGTQCSVRSNERHHAGTVQSHIGLGYALSNKWFLTHHSYAESVGVYGTGCRLSSVVRLSVMDILWLNCAR